MTLHWQTVAYCFKSIWMIRTDRLMPCLFWQIYLIDMITIKVRTVILLILVFILILVVVNETFRALYEISVIEISTFEQWKGLEQATKLKNYPLIITATT